MLFKHLCKAMKNDNQLISNDDNLWYSSLVLFSGVKLEGVFVELVPRLRLDDVSGVC